VMPRVLGSVDPDDVVVVEVDEPGPVPGFAPEPVGGALGRDHIERHAQCDGPVKHAAATGDLAVVVLDDDLIAEEPCRLGAGVGDQRLPSGQFQREFVAKECRQLPLDFLGPGLRPGEPQDVVVGITAIP
jgi:hypothetical protein